MASWGILNNGSWKACLLGLAVAGLATMAPFATAHGKTSIQARREQAILIQDTSTDDFDAMRKRGVVRVLVPYSRTLFFYDRGHQRGITAVYLQEFERYLNRKHRNRNDLPIVVAAIPTTRDRLLPDLLAGRGDLAAGDITILPERLERMDFSDPVGAPFTEIIISGPKTPSLRSLDDLAGQRVFVRAATSYHASLTRLNEDFAARSLPQIALQMLPSDLGDEDVFEMVNAGIIPIAVADDWVANLWRKRLPKMRLHPDLVLRDHASAGWAMRKNSPLLAAAVNGFMREEMNGKNLPKIVTSQVALQTKRLSNNRNERALNRFGATFELFKDYGERYRFDYLLLAAQGYQESRLDQNARSEVGAIGIMQLMPTTGDSMQVGDIKKVGPNIHAAAKYMDSLMRNLEDDAALDEKNRTLFAFASYNAGPSRIQRFRAEAAKHGYDPHIWFDNVERIAAKRIGRETVLYVRNIYKYYTAYLLAVEATQAQQRAVSGITKQQP